MIRSLVCGHSEFLNIYKERKEQMSLVCETTAALSHWL